MIDFLHLYIPSAVAFSVGPITVHWYGVIAASALIASWIVIAKISEWYDLKVDLFNLFFGIVISALAGARVYHVFNELGYYADNPLLVFQIWQGGLAFHGGLVGGVLYAWWRVRKCNLSFLRIADIFTPGIILFQAIGRWGNYFNQELFGTPTDLPWGIPILMVNRPASFQDFQYFHPTFLYESLFNIVVFVILITLHKKKSRGKITLSDGTIFFIYLMLYSVIRFFLEFIRVDDTPEILGTRLPQLVSFIIFLAALQYIYFFITHDRSITKQN